MSDVPDPQFPAKNQPISEAYNASQLGKLEGLEAVRKKPGMYIGGTDASRRRPSARRGRSGAGKF